jgi:hypothetical protein
MPEGEARKKTRELDLAFKRDYNRRRKRNGNVKAVEPDLPVDVDSESEEDAPQPWKDELLTRLHRLSPDGIEEFVLYLLRLYGMELQRVGGTGDGGIEGIGTAPISPVLSSRVAVQVKRYEPAGRPIRRDVVALFQRDASANGDVLCQPPTASSSWGGRGGGERPETEAPPAGGATPPRVRAERGERQPVGCVNAQPLSAGQPAVALQRCVLCGATG